MNLSMYCGYLYKKFKVMKILLVLLTIISKFTKGLDLNYINNVYSDNETFCQYLFKDRDWIDNQLSSYRGYPDNPDIIDCFVDDLYDERKKVDQMIYELCKVKDEL